MEKLRSIKSKITFRKLEMIEAVARRGTVSAAAEELAISQPALTQALKGIEADLDIILFTRGKRGLEPTAFVAPFLTHFAIIQAELQATKRELSSKTSATKRTLVVQCGQRSAKLWIEPIEAQASPERPYTINLNETIYDVYEHLIERKIDLAILPAFGFDKASELMIRPFSFMRNQFICRAGHPLLSLKAPSFRDIKNYPHVGDIVIPQYHHLFEGDFGQFAVKNEATGEVKAAFFETSLEQIFSKVKSSDALGLLPPDLFASFIQDKSLVVLNDSRCRLPELPVTIAYHKDNVNNPDLHDFIALSLIHI